MGASIDDQLLRCYGPWDFGLRVDTNSDEALRELRMDLGGQGAALAFYSS